ncbi:hypothetical protein D1BOALGB6SA_9148 [Olavius sp. associated proteobacterium Delta 1]|nr:hypothetical protein D1BOALGB6SA_9148 [Olavius sp. associated proteobacterium Delta 1]
MTSPKGSLVLIVCLAVLYIIEIKYNSRADMQGKRKGAYLVY